MNKKAIFLLMLVALPLRGMQEPVTQPMDVVTSAAQPMITLISQEGDAFQVPLSGALLSETIKGLIEGPFAQESQEITLNLIPSQTLKIISDIMNSAAQFPNLKDDDLAIAVTANLFPILNNLSPNQLTALIPASDFLDSDLLKQVVNLTPVTVKEVNQFNHAARKYVNLKGKALLDAIEKEIQISNPLLLLKIADQLNNALLRDFAAREIVKQNPQEILNQIIKARNLNEKSNHAIAGFYLLLKNSKLYDVSLSKPRNYSLSLRDYFDYRPQEIKQIIQHSKEEQARNPNKPFTLRFSFLHLKNIDGINKIPGINLDSVKGLDLVNNQITEISDNDFDGFINLQTLSLDDNYLKKIPSFINTPNLQELNLMSNQIEEVPVNAFKNLNNLETLALNNNKIKYIPPQALTHLQKLKALYLLGNPLSSENKKQLKNALPNVKILFETPKQESYGIHSHRHGKEEIHE